MSHDDSRHDNFRFGVIDSERYITAPDEFFEYLRDCEYGSAIKIEELMEALDDWIEE
jgi:hypothetical protein